MPPISQFVDISIFQFREVDNDELLQLQQPSAAHQQPQYASAMSTGFMMDVVDNNDEIGASNDHIEGQLEITNDIIKPNDP